MKEGRAVLAGANRNAYTVQGVGGGMTRIGIVWLRLEISDKVL